MIVKLYPGNDFSSLHFGLCSDMISPSKQAVPQPQTRGKIAVTASFFAGLPCFELYEEEMQ
jgi:hypothetical protein